MEGKSGKEVSLQAPEEGRRIAEEKRKCGRAKIVLLCWTLLDELQNVPVTSALSKLY